MAAVSDGASSASVTAPVLPLQRLQPCRLRQSTAWQAHNPRPNPPSLQPRRHLRPPRCCCCVRSSASTCGATCAASSCAGSRPPPPPSSRQASSPAVSRHRPSLRAQCGYRAAFAEHFDRESLQLIFEWFLTEVASAAPPAVLWATVQEPIAARVRPQIRQAATRECPPHSLQRVLHDALVAHTQVITQQALRPVCRVITDRSALGGPAARRNGRRRRGAASGSARELQARRAARDAAAARRREEEETARRAQEQLQAHRGRSARSGVQSTARGALCGGDRRRGAARGGKAGRGVGGRGACSRRSSTAAASLRERMRERVLQHMEENLLPDDPPIADAPSIGESLEFLGVPNAFRRMVRSSLCPQSLAKASPVIPLTPRTAHPRSSAAARDGWRRRRAGPRRDAA